MRWQPKCRMDVLQKRLSSATRLASTRVKFAAAQSSLRLSKVYGSKVKYTDIAVRSLTCLTATGTHMPFRITQCYLPPDRGDIPAFTPAEAGTRLSAPGGMQG